MDEFWSGRRVLVTGDTGFAGTWLSALLRHRGAEVAGFSRRTGGDVLDAAAVREATRGVQIVFHLAAQALTSGGAAETFAVNVVGTVNVLDAAREEGAAVVFASTAAVYTRGAGGGEAAGAEGAGRGAAGGDPAGGGAPGRQASARNAAGGECAGEVQAWPFREDDPIGPDDAYGASKAAAELAGRAFRRSFGVPFAAGRTPNLLGGGDSGAGRLVPALVAAARRGEEPVLRTPNAAHQWLHVLDAAAGHLLVARRLLEDPDCPDAFNLAPDDAGTTVRDLAVRVGRLGEEARGGGEAPERPREEREAREARADAEGDAARAARTLDASRAKAFLGWRPVWDLDAALARTLAWRGDADTAAQVAEHDGSPTLSRR